MLGGRCKKGLDLLLCFLKGIKLVLIFFLYTYLPGTLVKGGRSDIFFCLFVWLVWVGVMIRRNWNWIDEADRYTILYCMYV